MKNAKIHPPYNHTNILHLPDHIIKEIFCKLPTKALVRCRFVCKPWFYFFKDPQFTKKLFARTPSASSCVLVHNYDGRRTKNPDYKGYFLVDFDNSWRRSLNDDVMMNLPEDLKVKYCLEVVGSCNGLLCLNDLGRRFYISNPITGESLLLPEPVKNEKIVIPYVSGFGFSPISNVYTVLLIYTIQGSDVGEVMVLSLGSSGLWRSVGSSVYPQRESQPYMTRLNGRLHWSVKSNGSLLICSFDLETEKLQELPPFSLEQANSKFVTLGVLGGCLCLMGWNGDNVSSSIWVMKDYGVEGCWTKEHEIDGVGILYSTRVLKYTKEEGILLLHGYKFWAYAPGQKGLQRVKADGMPSVIRGACDFIPNFVPLNNIITG